MDKPDDAILAARQAIQRGHHAAEDRQAREYEQLKQESETALAATHAQILPFTGPFPAHPTPEMADDLLGHLERLAAHPWTDNYDFMGATGTRTALIETILRLYNTATAAAIETGQLPKPTPAIAQTRALLTTWQTRKTHHLANTQSLLRNTGSSSRPTADTSDKTGSHDRRHRQGQHPAPRNHGRILATHRTGRTGRRHRTGQPIRQRDPKTGKLKLRMRR